jgi:hypothetical protein
MLIELVNETIIAFRLASSELFYGKYAQKVFQREKNLLTPIIRLMSFGIRRISSIDESNGASHISLLFNFDSLR